MYFDLKQTAILQATQLNKRPVFRNAKFFSKLFGALGLIFFAVFTYTVLSQQFSEIFLNRILAGALFSFSFGFSFGFGFRFGFSLHRQEFNKSQTRNHIKKTARSFFPGFFFYVKFQHV